MFSAQVQVPKNITAINSDRHQFFVEADGMKGEYVSACCAFEAKSKFIYALVEKKTEGHNE